MSANQIAVTEGSGKNVATETVGSTDYGLVEIVGRGGASVVAVNPDGSINASIKGLVNVYGSVSGTLNVVQSGTVITSVSGIVPVLVTGSVLAIASPTASLISGITSIVTSTSQTSVTATIAGGQRAYITHILVTNGAAGTGAFVDIMSGPTVMTSGFAAAGGGGFSATYPADAPLRQPHTVTSIDMKASAQASIKVEVAGYSGA